MSRTLPQGPEQAKRAAARYSPSRLLRAALLAGFASGAVACSGPPPPSQFPDAEAALSRLHENQACSRGVSGEAKLDYFGKTGRVRGSLLYLTSAPDRIRFDVYSPFGATLSTLTSDGQKFALYDLKNKSFLRGPATTCNLQRFTQVPLPPHAFVTLLRGDAPVLVHEPRAAELTWDSGAYLVTVPSRHRAEQRLRLEPHPADFDQHWSKQRLRLVEVQVEQAGVELYQVELEGHRAANTAKARVDPDGIDDPIPPSGPECRAEIPRRLRFLVEGEEHDVILTADEVSHNPPLVAGVFEQEPRPGVVVRYSPCTD